MTTKWTNKNLPGALHFITANCDKRLAVFKDERYCLLVLEVLEELKERWPFKLIAYVLMPDHFHLIVNSRDGRITDLTGAIKGMSARRIIDASPEGAFADGVKHQVWQDSFKAFPLWSDWMI